MWQPEPSWTRLRAGPSSHGVWRVEGPDGPTVVKRLVRPAVHEPAEALRPAHATWWRREADAALDGRLAATPGLRRPGTVTVEEDPEGITVVERWVEPVESTGPFLARALGRFAGADLPAEPWHATDLLADRLTLVERRGGWQGLARTTMAEAAARLWERRVGHLAVVAALPQVPQHGDPVPGNLMGRDGREVVAVDWSTFGSGPVGADLGYLALGAREDLETLLDAYVGGLPPGLASAEQARTGARVMAGYTVLTRVDWALTRVAGTTGDPTGRLRHPAVAPHLRALRRQLPQIEALLG